MTDELKYTYLEMLFQSRLQMIDPYMLPSDVNSDILESCWPIYVELNQRESANASSQKL